MIKPSQNIFPIALFLLLLLFPNPAEAEKKPLLPGLKRRLEPQAKNVRLVGWTDMDGRADGLQVVGQGDGYVYVGHVWSAGFSVIDVQDPRNPHVVKFVPAPKNTVYINLQVADNLLIVASEQDVFAPGGPQEPFEGGIKIFDVSDPRNPRELSFFRTPGQGTHRNWYSGGRYVYLSASREGYSKHRPTKTKMDSRVFEIVDILDPRHPREVSFWTFPDHKSEEGELPPWIFLHGPIVSGNYAYLGYLSDAHGGGAILDINNPTQPKLVAEFSTNPPFGNGHTFLPLPHRKLAVLADENLTYYCRGPLNLVWIMDVQTPQRPIPLSTLPLPTKGEFCDRPVRSGPHNMHENRPGSKNDEYMIYLAAFNQGVRIYDISNPFRPEEVGYYVPADPQWRMDNDPVDLEVGYSGSDLTSVQDVYVDQRGYIYATDYNGGLYVLEYTGPPPRGSEVDPRVGRGLTAR